MSHKKALTDLTGVCYRVGVIEYAGGGDKTGRCKVPVYEYFCPSCCRELEVLRPIRSASDCSECPDCGGKAWRLVSGFGSKTGSYLQPSGMPFRDEPGWRLPRGETVATVRKSDVDTGSPVDYHQASSSVEMSWLLESQPNGSNIWFIPDWGIASILRYLREDVELDEVAAAGPVEDPVHPTVVCQRIEPPGPEERMAEPVKATEPDTGSSGAPTVAHVGIPANHRSRKPAVVTRPKGRTRSAPVRQRIPRSYFGWFVLVLASIAVIVALLVWILAMAA
jgi:putative FmdB family regulatory protein